MKSFLLRLLGISNKLLAFFLPIFKKAAADVLEQLLPLALEVVSSLDSKKISGEKKFDQAFKTLTSKAEEVGISAGVSIINFAIESAVQRLKAEKD